MFDLFDSDWIGDASDLGDAVDMGDSADTIGSAVSDAYGAVGGSAPDYTEFVTNPELADALSNWTGGYDLEGGGGLFTGEEGGNSGGMTGIGWIDRVLGRLGNQWERDPLAMLGAGVGVLGKIDAIRQMQGHKPWVGGRGASGSDGSAEAAAAIQRMDSAMGNVRNSGSAAFNSMANRLPTDTQIPIAAPIALDPSLYLQQGALSKIKR